MVDLPDLAIKYLGELEKNDFQFLKNEANNGELAAFCSFALSFPSNFLALVDTYNVLK
jgi:nicotinate phosphoribosyltransferase